MTEAPLAGTDWTSLKGKFFHSFCVGGRFQKQGWFEADGPPGYVIVRWFEWLSGSNGCGRGMIPISQVSDEKWWLYESAEEMRETYEYSGVRAHDGSECPCTPEPVTLKRLHDD